MYADTSDPWNFSTSAYEQAKYRATIAALGGRRFGRAFEIGCSIGVLTSMLAGHCAALLAIDINERALEAARARCAQLPNVSFALMPFPQRTPAGPFDLIVMSEVAYYWSDDDLRAAADFRGDRRRRRHAPAGPLFAPVEDYVRDGDAVHAAFLADSRFVPEGGARADKYRIDVLRVR